GPPQQEERPARHEGEGWKADGGPELVELIRPQLRRDQGEAREVDPPSATSHQPANSRHGATRHSRFTPREVGRRPARVSAQRYAGALKPSGGHATRTKARVRMSKEATPSRRAAEPAVNRNARKNHPPEAHASFLPQSTPARASCGPPGGAARLSHGKPP